MLGVVGSSYVRVSIAAQRESAARAAAVGVGGGGLGDKRWLSSQPAVSEQRHQDGQEEVRCSFCCLHACNCQAYFLFFCGVCLHGRLVGFNDVHDNSSLCPIFRVAWVLY